MCEKSKLVPTINNLVKYTSIDNSYALQPFEQQWKKKKSEKLTIPQKIFKTTQEDSQYFSPTNHIKSFVTCKLRNRHRRTKPLLLLLPYTAAGQYFPALQQKPVAGSEIKSRSCRCFDQTLQQMWISFFINSPYLFQDFTALKNCGLCCCQSD